MEDRKRKALLRKRKQESKSLVQSNLRIMNDPNRGMLGMTGDPTNVPRFDPLPSIENIQSPRDSVAVRSMMERNFDFDPSQRDSMMHEVLGGLANRGPNNAPFGATQASLIGDSMDRPETPQPAGRRYATSGGRMMGGYGSGESTGRGTVGGFLKSFLQGGDSPAFVFDDEIVSDTHNPLPSVPFPGGSGPGGVNEPLSGLVGLPNSNISNSLIHKDIAPGESEGLEIDPLDLQPKYDMYEGMTPKEKYISRRSNFASGQRTRDFEKYMQSQAVNDAVYQNAFDEMRAPTVDERLSMPIADQFVFGQTDMESRGNVVSNDKALRQYRADEDVRMDDLANSRSEASNAGIGQQLESLAKISPASSFGSYFETPSAKENYRISSERNIESLGNTVNEFFESNKNGDYGNWSSDTKSMLQNLISQTRIAQSQSEGMNESLITPSLIPGVPDTVGPRERRRSEAGANKAMWLRRHLQSLISRSNQKPTQEMMINQRQGFNRTY